MVFHLACSEGPKVSGGDRSSAISRRRPSPVAAIDDTVGAVALLEVIRLLAIDAEDDLVDFARQHALRCPQMILVGVVPEQLPNA